MHDTQYTLAEEDYIKAIYHLSKNTEGAFTNAIAEMLGTKPASVSDMLQKLSEKKVVNYVKYKGVTLTEEGKRVALKIVRKHRLWEVFLVEKLRFSWHEVHEIAEQLEHINSPLLIERLDEFLGYPKNDPHGDPIPDEYGTIPHNPKSPLSELGVDAVCQVTTVRDTNQSFLRYLDKVGIYIGAKIRILDRIEYDGSLEIVVDDKKDVTLSREIAKNILVTKLIQ
jgi:DtxR family Mn-dependent transcriptional regulator